MSPAFLGLQALAIVLAVVGVAKATTLLLASITAERDWGRAVDRLSAEQLQQLSAALTKALADTAEHRRYGRFTPVDQLQFPAELQKIVFMLQQENALPDRSARVIEAALSQPSATGRRGYAKKLANEAIRHRHLAAG